MIVWPEGPEGMLKPSLYSVVIQGRSHSYSRVADGSYVIPDIPPGHYKLVSVAWAESEYLGEGDTTFDVTNADVVLRLTLGGLAEIQGVAKTDKTRTGIPEGVILWIQSQESGAQGSRMDAAGKFAFGRVLPGEYRFSVLKNPEGIVLRSGAVRRCGGNSAGAAAEWATGRKLPAVKSYWATSSPRATPPNRSSLRAVSLRSLTARRCPGDSSR